MTYDQRKRQLAAADQLAHDACHGIRGAQQMIREMNPAQALAELVAARAVIEAAEYSVVLHLRSFGSTWQEIGDALGTTRQAAWARYHDELND